MTKLKQTALRQEGYDGRRPLTLSDTIENADRGDMALLAEGGRRGLTVLETLPSLRRAGSPDFKQPFET
jgi:hypothetical protein